MFYSIVNYHYYLKNLPGVCDSVNHYVSWMQRLHIYINYITAFNLYSSIFESFHTWVCVITAFHGLLFFIWPLFCVLIVSIAPVFPSYICVVEYKM